jgi:hypothetical protein
MLSIISGKTKFLQELKYKYVRIIVSGFGDLLCTPETIGKAGIDMFIKG